METIQEEQEEEENDDDAFDKASKSLFNSDSDIRELI